MMSIKDYAADRGVSYEAVRRQVKRYKAELEGHVIQKGRQQFLDDFAVAFLDEHRAAQPMVTYDQATGAAVKRLEARCSELEAENKELLKEVAALSKWHAENALALAAADQTQRLLTAAQDEKVELQRKLDVEQAAHKADKEADAAALQTEQEAKLEAQGKQRAAENRADELQRKLDALAKRRLIDRILNRGV